MTTPARPPRHWYTRVVIVLAGVVALGRGLEAQVQQPPAFAPPPGYYQGVNTNVVTSGAPNLDLKAQVYQRTRYLDYPLNTLSHTVISYADARVALGELELNVDASGAVVLPPKIVTLYSGILRDPLWSNGSESTWNREHCWPQSRGASTGPLQSDEFNVHACVPSVNSARGNLNYGSPQGTYWDPDHLLGGATLPGYSARGEVARAAMYVDARYALDPDYAGLTLASGNPGYVTSAPSPMGDRTKLVAWHYDHPPSVREMRRNHLLASGFTTTNTVNGISTTLTLVQGNRNPFIDNPEWAWALYGSGPSDATLYFDVASGGAAIPPSGASAASVTYRAITGASLARASVTLYKAGAAPTYFSATATGAGVGIDPGSPIVPGKFNALGSGAKSRTLVVAFTAPTSTPGITVGTVTIHNSELTTLRPGTGRDDADDVLSISATILDHAHPSFDPQHDTHEFTLDFGDVIRLTGPRVRSYSVYNRAISPPSLTASLTIDSLTPGESSGPFTHAAVTTPVIAPGESARWDVTLDTAAPAGRAVVTYTLRCSDEPLPGSSSTDLVLSLMANLIDPCNQADLTDTSGTGRPDGQLTGSDVVMFFQQFFGGCDAPGAVPCNRADITDASGTQPPDGQVTGSDVLLFFQQFFSPCSPPI